MQVVCSHPKSSWQLTIGLHLPKGESVALYPEEALYLHCAGKIAISGIASSSLLAKTLLQPPDSIQFTINTFILYKHLRSNSYIVKRDSYQPLIDGLRKEGFEVAGKKQKVEECSSARPWVVFKVYQTTKDCQADKVDFLVTLKEDGSVSHEDLKFCASRNLKLALVKEAKVVLLHVGTV